MNPTPLPLTTFDVAWVWIGLKWVYVLLGAFFVLVGLVMMAQLKQMMNAFCRQFNRVLLLVGAAFLALAAGSLMMAVLVL